MVFEVSGRERYGGSIGSLSGDCLYDESVELEAAMGVERARKESKSRAVTLPAEVHWVCGDRCSRIVKVAGKKRKREEERRGCC